ncbi:DUF1811 family protein [Paenibacillus sp. OAS669]|uniref:DUF1811 family protein n=1 Tax=Paenibacillus sp. OAS669 TaxID=2663821 RepID=UPI0017896C69|nr:DUF1811 family protein [Paenibacillus sp. OAS669]MBE1446986.1 hypothetical protein [Paenibacillus sp. OAS669]
MKKLYSQMSPGELDAELADILEALAKAEFPSQKELIERKYYTAKSYLLDPSDFQPGTYRVEGFEEPFELEYINGMMGWGKMGNDPEASFPISMLTRA